MRVRSILVGLVILAASAAAGQQPPTPGGDGGAAYQRILDGARQSEQAGDLDGALAALEGMLRLGGDAVPVRVRAEAIERVLSLEAAINARHSMSGDAARQMRSVVATKTFWVIAPVVMLVLWRLYAWRHPRTDAAAAFFEDLTRPVGERTEASLVLTRTVLDQLQNPLPMRVETLEMDMMPGSEEPGFGGLQSALNTSPIDGFELAAAPMKVGGVEFTVRDLAAALSGLFHRPHAAHLTGWLSESDHGVVAHAQFVDRSDPQRNHSWRLRVSGKGSRAEAISDLAAQILVDTGNSRLTHSWKSLRAFRRALALRQSAGPRGPRGLREARNYLEEAVTLDSSNWIARFNLALTLCRCGEPEIALGHFTILEDVIQLAWESNRNPAAPCSKTPAFQDVKDHLSHFPECAFLIQYNKAMALAALHEPKSTEAALRELERLAALDKNDGDLVFAEPYRALAQTLTPRARTELSLYALGAQANLLVGTPARVHPEDQANGIHPVETLLATIEARCSRTQELHWRSLQTARAVALASAARVAALGGDTARARERLEAAIAAEPHFVEAYVSLAELHLDFMTSCDSDWHRRAEMLLQRALELSPGCGRAMSLLARLPSAAQPV